MPGFDIDDFREALKQGAIEWQLHVLKMIVERGIERKSVLDVLLRGERIEDYPTDFPYPSALFLGWIKQNPIHVVAAYCSDLSKVFVITTYVPDLDHFESDFKTRKNR